MSIRNILLVLCVVLGGMPLSVNAASDLDGGVKELAGQLSKTIIDNKKKKIAVLSFNNLDRTTSMFGVYLSEELITKLFVTSPGKFEVVERSQLDKVMTEHKLSASGLLNASAMSKIGKILGVDAIVIGSIADLDNSVKVNARIISVSSARVFAVASTSIPKIGIVAKLMMQPMEEKGKTDNVRQNVVKTKSPLKSGALSENGLSFSLDTCIRKSNQVDCVITVVAEKSDNIVTVYGNYGRTKSIVYDDVGTARAASRTDISGSANTRYVKRKLVAGVKNKLRLQFHKMSGYAKKVSLLSVKYHAANNNQAGEAEFRDILIQ